MEKLALTCHVLYNQELLDVKQELEKLKKRYETPKIIFDRWSDWETGVERMYSRIEECINEWMEKEGSDMKWMQRVTPRQHIYWWDCISHELKELTNNSLWSRETAWQVMYGLEGFISVLGDDEHWESLYDYWQGEVYIDTVRDNGISRLIIRYIRRQLGNGEHDPCLLGPIPHMKCPKCGEIDNCDFDDENTECHSKQCQKET